MSRILISASALALATLTTASVSAQSPRDEMLLRCLGIENDAARLACFDEVVSSEPSEPAAETPADASDEETEARRFGLPMPSFPSFQRFGGGEREEERDDLETETTEETRILERGDDGDLLRVMMTVSEVTEVGHGTQRFHMANGQVWEAGGGRSLRIPRREPLQAEIRRGVLGGYTMKLNGSGRSIRVRRIDN